MIELGDISIKDLTSIVEARNKIRILCEDLKFDSISAVRLAAITSELSRRMATSGHASSVGVGLDQRGGAFGLVLLFASAQTGNPVGIEALEAVFDDVEEFQTTVGLEAVKAFKSLPDPEFEPTEEFIDQERELVQRLTREELYAQLQEAYDKLRHSSQLIQTEKMVATGTLVAGVAHELNNPMTGMLQFAEYCLKYTTEDDRRYPVLRDIKHETKRCIDIVQNLLTFSRMEKEGEEGYQQESFATILDRVFKLLSYRIEREHVSLTSHVAEGVPEIWMKASSMQQMFLNLINNALDALKERPKKEIRVEVRHEGESIRVTVADTGSGIDTENLKRIFDPFFTTKPVGQGTGMGLAIIQSIIDMHDGKITCHSTPGVGTTFNILFPIERRREGQNE